MELWLIKNGDVPDLATSLYHMDHYKSINSKFQILDTFIKFNEYVELNLNILLINNKEVSDFQI